MSSLRTMRQNCFLGMFVVGALTGVLQRYWGNGATALDLGVAVLGVFMAGFFGGFAGFFLINLQRSVRGKEPNTGAADDGMLLGAFAGALVALIGQLVFSSHMPTALGNAAGAFVGGFLGAFPDEYLPGFFRLFFREGRPLPHTDSE